MAEWYHRLNGHEFEQALGDGEGQGRLACCSPWGQKVWDTTEQLNNNCLLGQISLYAVTCSLCGLFVCEIVQWHKDIFETSFLLKTVIIIHLGIGWVVFPAVTWSLNFTMTL